VILSTVYTVVRRLLSLPALLLRRSVSKEAELLVLRHQNAVLRRQVPRVRYQPAASGSCPHRKPKQHRQPPSTWPTTQSTVEPILGGLTNEYRIAS
jgi:hypothetical protein